MIIVEITVAVIAALLGLIFIGYLWEKLND